MTSLSRSDVLAIAAHVQAGNLDGCAEDLLVKLRALYRWLPPRGCWSFDAPHEPGAPDTVVVDPTISAEAGDGGHAAQGDPARPTFGPETAPSPAAADSPITVAGGRIALRTETIDAIFSGGAGMPDPEQQLNKRRRARTRAV